MAGGRQGGKQKPLKAPKAPKKEYDEVRAHKQCPITYPSFSFALRHLMPSSTGCLARRWHDYTATGYIFFS